MVTPEPSHHTTGKCKYPNGDTEEIEFKWNFMRMMKAFKEEVKNSLTEMAKKHKQKLEEIKKSLKGTQENTFKQSNRWSKHFEQFNIDEALKKPKTKGIQDKENLGKWKETTEQSLSNIIQEMKERILRVEDTINEVDSIVKENLKSNKLLSQNIQKVWNTKLWQNFRIIWKEG